LQQKLKSVESKLIVGGVNLVSDVMISEGYFRDHSKENTKNDMGFFTTKNIPLV
jgi:hypothetical protein